jgi:hypothetical protein
MKTIYSLEVTNYQSTNPRINSVTLFFDEHIKAANVKAALVKKGYKCSRPFARHLESGVVEEAVKDVDYLIGK